MLELGGDSEKQNTSFAGEKKNVVQYRLAGVWQAEGQGAWFMSEAFCTKA